MVSEISNGTPAAVTAVEQRMVKLDKTQSQQAPATAAPSGPGDTLKLTDLASRLRDLTQSVADVPVVDAQRVEQFQKAINDGSYRIDSVQIAEKLYGFETMMASGPAKA
jgi:flagellar biosynthesis anti-sigma factor FlgM